MIKHWIIFGELQDPYKEFFVEINEKVSEDEVWNTRYNLIIKNIPNFFNKNMTIKLFEIGKCVNFIRNYCDNPNFSMLKLKEKIVKIGEDKIKSSAEVEKVELNNIIKEEKVHEIKNDNKMIIDDVPISNNLNKMNIEQNDNQSISENQKNERKNVHKSLDFIFNIEDESVNMACLNELYSEIDLVHQVINKELITIIFDKFKFKAHLESIYRYLLLGQGDMMQYLMELLVNELKKPASQIYKHNLLSILDSAIRASNAQYHEQECIKKLNIKLFEPNSGDTGWDIFVLEYNIDMPLKIIFTKTLLREYQKLFFFFWKLKRLEFTQNHQIWRSLMTYSHSKRKNFDFLRPHIQRILLFNQQIIHFVTNLHDYITLEVLETEWKNIMEKLENVDYLDNLIFLHKSFVSNVTGKYKHILYNHI